MAIASVSSLVSTGVGANNAATGLAQAENAQKNPLAGLLQRNDASSNTQLSVLGRTKLSLEDLQAAAQAAKNINNPPTLSDFKVAVQGVVQSLNALTATVRASESTQSRATSFTDQRPNQALNQVRNSLQEERGNQSLQRLGISRNEEGGFALNQRQLEASFQQDRPGSLSALFDVADRVERAADRALDETTTSPARQDETETEPEPTEETQAEKEQRNREVQRESFRELLAAQLANTRSYVARNAVATYFSVAAL